MTNPLKQIRESYLRRKSDKEQWDGLMVQMEHNTQVQSRAITLFLKALMVYCIVAGGMGCVLSAIDVTYYAVLLHGVIFLSAVLCVSLYYTKWWENVGYLLIFMIMAVLAMKYSAYINSGFYAILNDLAEIVSEYFDSNAMRSYGEKIANRPLAITFSMSYFGIVACLLVNILISRKMNVMPAILVLCGFLFLPLYVELEPAFGYVLQLVLGLILSVFLHQGGQYELTGTNQRFQKKGHKISYVYAKRTIIQAGALLSLFLILFSLIFYPFLGQRNYGTSIWKEKTKDSVETVAMLGIAGLFNYYPNTGGLTSGKLGGVSAIRYDYNTDLKITFVPNSDQRFYLRQFVGNVYRPYDNRWEWAVDKDILMNTQQAYQNQYLSQNKYSGAGTIRVDNVAATAAVYLPYYSMDYDKPVLRGRSQTYVYYTAPQLYEGQEVEPESLHSWLDVPAQNRETLEEFAAQAKLNNLSLEETVSTLAAYFQEQIPYSYQPGFTPRGKDFVNYFLEENRRGYCAHFASATTLMLRQLGYPARYVEGYAIDPDDITDEGTVLTEEPVEKYYQGYHQLEQTGVVEVNVTDACAHAWVEVYQQGQGWRIVDITPASQYGDQPGGNLWNLFMRFLGGSDANTLQEKSNPGRDADIKVSTVFPAIMDVIKKILIFVIVSILMVFTVGVIIRKIKHHNQNRNDRLIDQYRHYIRKKERNIEGLAECKNYQQQIRLLANNQEKHRIDILDQDNQDRLIKILEQAGFGAKEISQEEYQWAVQILSTGFFDKIPKKNR